ncbi:DUF6089 family protein [Rapidithrix thailandica]|uniref:DUF6089 family protein n=1 Tax=Rapidithrix thailandica TaxID=413964 RepID=A0AAW9RXE5_9BACT
MRYIKLFLSAFLLLLLIQTANAQRFEVGGGFGVMNYKGDLAPSVNVIHSRPSANLLLRYNFNPYLSWRNSLVFGFLTAEDRNSSDPYLKRRNFTFTGGTVGLHSMIEYHFFDLWENRKFLNFSPFISAGLAFNSFNSKLKYGSDDRRNEEFAVSIPLGIGIRKALDLNWSIGLELITYKTFTDNVDGLGEIENATKFQKGNPNDNDTVYHFGVTISYRFVDIKCPKPIADRYR